MEALSAVYRAIDSFFMAVTIALASFFGALNIDVPLLTPYAPLDTPADLSTPITHTTVSIQADTSSESQAPAKTPSEITSDLPVAVTPTPALPSPSNPVIKYEQVNTDARAALVNILCLARSSSGIGSVSGSGAFIDPRGIVLTNAHIAQFFLLKDYPSPNSVECTIRTGSPAEPRYRAELLYLPPAWIDANASQLKAEKPIGTGEHDYAFLRITGTTDPNGVLPAVFPSLSMTTDDPAIGEEVLLAAYPAGFLDGTSIERDLYITSAFTVVQKLFTFNENGFIDVISIGGTVVSQGGSSGGVVVRGKDSKALGVIATATAGNTTGDRDLRAIMLSHVNRSLTSQGRGSISALLAGNPSETAADFAAQIAPSERQKLIDALTSN